MIKEGLYKNWRCWVLGVLSVVDFLLLVAVPTDESSDWLADTIKIKVAAGVLMYVVMRMANYWRRAGKLRELEEFMNEYKGEEQWN